MKNFPISSKLAPSTAW